MQPYNVDEEAMKNNRKNACYPREYACVLCVAWIPRRQSQTPHVSPIYTECLCYDMNHGIQAQICNSVPTTDDCVPCMLLLVLRNINLYARILCSNYIYIMNIVICELHIKCNVDQPMCVRYRQQTTAEHCHFYSHLMLFSLSALLVVCTDSCILCKTMYGTWMYYLYFVFHYRNFERFFFFFCLQACLLCFVLFIFFFQYIFSKGTCVI